MFNFFYGIGLAFVGIFSISTTVLSSGVITAETAVSSSPSTLNDDTPQSTNQNQDFGQNASVDSSQEASKTHQHIQKMKKYEGSTHLQKIIKSGVLRVGMHKKDHTPYFMTTETGNFVGIDIDLAKEIAKQLGVRVEFIRTENTFDDVVQLVIDGKADVVISKLSLTLERAKKVLYTKPYSSLTKSVLVNRTRLLQVGSNKSANEMFSQPGAIIAVLKGSSYVPFARRIFPKAQIYEGTDWYGDILPRVFKGEFWGAFRDELEVRRSIFLAENAALYVLAVNFKDEKDPFMMVVNKEARMLRDWLNLFLDFVYKKVPITNAIKKYEEYVYELSAEEVQ